MRRSSSIDGAESERTAERYHRAMLGAGASVMSRLAGVGLMVLTVHWAAPRLGPERFGVWATFSSITAALAFLDLGVGNALVNRIAQAAAGGDSRQVSPVIMGGLGWLAVIGAAAAILLAAASGWIPWTALFKLSSVDAGHETRSAALAFSGLFGLNIVSAGGLKILMGQQRVHEGQSIATAAALLACPATWLAIRSGHDVALLLLAGLGTQSIVVILGVLALLGRRGLLDWRGIGRSMRQERRQLLSTGSLFLIVQIGVAVGWGSDTLVLAGIAGAADTAAFAVAQRLFLFASQPVAILNGSLWAAYADAHARDDRSFIRATLRRSFAASVAIGAVLSALLLIFGVRLASFWTESTITVPWALLAIFALWTPLEAAGMAVGNYLNGTGIVREQVIVVLSFCVLALPAKVFATIHAGAAGLVAATALAYAITHVGLYGLVLRQRILAPIRRSSPAGSIGPQSPPAQPSSTRR